VTVSFVGVIDATGEQKTTLFECSQDAINNPIDKVTLSQLVSLATKGEYGCGEASLKIFVEREGDVVRVQIRCTELVLPGTGQVISTKEGPRLFPKKPQSIEDLLKDYDKPDKAYVKESLELLDFVWVPHEESSGEDKIKIKLVTLIPKQALNGTVVPADAGACREAKGFRISLLKWKEMLEDPVGREFLRLVRDKESQPDVIDVGLEYSKDEWAHLGRLLKEEFPDTNFLESCKCFWSVVQERIEQLK
jgi:hypothetical protein